MTEFKDYYKLLNVAEDASQEDIKKSYRRLARKYHPDVSKEPNAEVRFKEVGEAYEALKDPKRRQQYDELRRGGWQQGDQFRPPPGWADGVGGGFGEAGASGFGDFFDMLFGGLGGQRGPGQRGHGQGSPFAQPGRDLQAKVSIDLETAITGGTQRIGVGGRTLSVKIPAGVTDGQRIRLSGQGEPGQAGGPSGHLYLDIHILPHRLYRLDGRDILIDWPISPWEAALGAQLKVPTPQGSVSIKIPANSSSHQRMRLKGRGLPAKGQQTAGDAYVVLKIKSPPSWSTEQKDLWEALAKASDFDPRKDLPTQ